MVIEDAREESDPPLLEAMVLEGLRTAAFGMFALEQSLSREALRPLADGVALRAQGPGLRNGSLPRRASIRAFSTRHLNWSPLMREIPGPSVSLRFEQTRTSSASTRPRHRPTCAP